MILRVNTTSAVTTHLCVSGRRVNPYEVPQVEVTNCYQCSPPRTQSSPLAGKMLDTRTFAIQLINATTPCQHTRSPQITSDQGSRHRYPPSRREPVGMARRLQMWSYFKLPSSRPRLSPLRPFVHNCMQKHSAVETEVNTETGPGRHHEGAPTTKWKV